MAAEIADRARLHELIDALPSESLEPAGRYLEQATDPMIAVLDAAPWDDEPLTAEDAAAIAEAEAAYSRGEGVSLEALEAELAGRDD